MNNNTVAVTVDNFQSVILEGSKSKIVLVDFWAEQIPESMHLRDQLSKALAGFSDVIIHATVDCQTQQQIAGQFGIQSLPTVVVLKDAQPIDGLTGPQTPENVTAFLEKYLPKPEDDLLIQAKALLLEHNVNAAFTAISQAYKLNNERADIKFVLADALILTGKISAASEILASIKMVDQTSDYQALMAKLELAEQAADSPEIKTLEAQLENDADNLELLQKLAAQYSQVNRNEEALAILFRLVQKDSSDAHSKGLLLDVLKAQPAGDPLVTKYRRKLYTLMY